MTTAASQRTECVLCTSACFTEHLSADPGECGGGEVGARGVKGVEGRGRGLRTIVSPSTMGASEKASQQSLQQPSRTHGNTYGECGLSGEGWREGGRGIEGLEHGVGKT